MTTEAADRPVAIVTGAGSGIGRATALELGARGHRVAVLDRDTERGEHVAAELGDRGRFVAVDMADPDEVRAAVDAVAGAWGRIDALVNNAGIAIAKPFLEYTEAEVRRVLDVNVVGAFVAQQAVVPHLLRAGGGRIVNVASTAAFVSSSTPESVYDMSKAAIRQLTVSSAVELAPLGINVNAVAPGTIATELTLAVLDTPAAMEKASAKIPARRLGRPEDIAAAIAFLLSDAADYVHGHVLVVDGGWLLE